MAGTANLSPINIISRSPGFPASSQENLQHNRTIFSAYSHLTYGFYFLNNPYSPKPRKRTQEGQEDIFMAHTDLYIGLRGRKTAEETLKKLNSVPIDIEDEYLRNSAGIVRALSTQILESEDTDHKVGHMIWIYSPNNKSEKSSDPEVQRVVLRYVPFDKNPLAHALALSVGCKFNSSFAHSPMELGFGIYVGYQIYGYLNKPVKSQSDPKSVDNLVADLFVRKGETSADLCQSPILQWKEDAIWINGRFWA